MKSAASNVNITINLFKRIKLSDTEKIDVWGSTWKAQALVKLDKISETLCLQIVE